jgi:heme-degrading monooxygenase HmoA
MMARMWRGWTRAADAGRYERHYREDVLAHLTELPGFRGARLVCRTVDGETEFLSLTVFDSLDDVRAFAGDDYTRAVVAAPARRVLIRYDERVTHYRITVENWS